ncbi:RNA-directed DNA polymerase, eukaryota, reverse transcriptase zinc-binding domain protein [Tanacetum coccineum]
MTVQRATDLYAPKLKTALYAGDLGVATPRALVYDGVMTSTSMYVVDVVTCFFHQGYFPKGGNSYFITLIPKTPDANLVKDFRPISLIGSMYKIIVKILANRLVVVLGDLVNEVQSAFVADRQILDGPFILNELLQWCKSKKKQSLVFKVDFEMAYDSVRWDYLDDILRKFSFGEKCYGNSTCLVPKSGGCSESNINIIIHILDCFHQASGLHIKMSKSKLMGISVDADKVDQAAMKIGCVTLKTLFTYLGSKVGVVIFTQSSSLWERVIKAIHGEDEKIGKKAKSTYPSIWLDIVHEVELFKYQGTYLVSYIHKKLGNGGNTSFWEDAWRGDTAFKCLYPRVYALELCKSIDVASKMAHSNLGYSFSRDPRGGVEQAQFDFMLAKVASNTRWIKAVPIKVNVHAWKAKLDCLPTRLNISCRGREILRKISRWWDFSYTEVSSYEEWHIGSVLVFNLRTAWMGGFHLFADVAKYGRTYNRPVERSGDGKPSRIFLLKLKIKVISELLKHKSSEGFDEMLGLRYGFGGTIGLRLEFDSIYTGGVPAIVNLWAPEVYKGSWVVWGSSVITIWVSDCSNVSWEGSVSLQSLNIV